MMDEDQAAELRGQILLDAAEQEVGRIEEIFVLPALDAPAFAAVKLDDRSVVVPLDEAEFGDGQVTARYDRAAIEGAPEAESEAIDPDLEQAVYAHYGISDVDLRDDSGFPLTEDKRDRPETSGDPRGVGGGADDALQGHP